MKKFNFCLCIAVLFFTQAKAQFVQREFMIGANWAPQLIVQSATPAPADYNGDGRADLASRINSGPNQGKFQIDYYSTSNPWFHQQGWSFKTTSAIYGAASDFVVSGYYDADSLADIAVYFPATKTWRIDYAANGFGSWDVSYSYSSNTDIDSTAIPVPADYDGDKKTDISFKTAAGKWIIDYSANGFGAADATKTGYGNSTEHPVPADYDGDHKADLSVKTDLGVWKIDYAANGYLGWDATITGCGNATEHPVPADYNHDGKADLSVKTDAGAWKVTYSFTSGTAVSWLPFGLSYGGVEAVPYPSDFNGDGKADFSFAFTNDGRWWIDNYSASTPGYDWASFPGKLADNFNMSSLDPADIASYTKFKNCNFNLTLDAPIGNFSYNSQKDYYLQLMDNTGLNAMLTDPYIYSFGDEAPNSPFDKAAFVTHFRTSIAANLKSRIYAINLGDEPSNVASDSRCSCNPITRVKDWSNFFDTAYPEKPTFNNLLPIYGFASTAAYGTYLDQYKANSKSPFVCFDHYPFRTVAPLFVTSYFDNLSMVKSKFPDRSLWSTIWSALSSTDNIPYPNEKQLQFMAFAPIAYGAKGIMYFPYDKSYNPNFSLALNNDNTNYSYAKNLNLFLKNIVGPVTIGSKNIATLHKLNGSSVTTYGYTLPAASPELISNYTGLVKDVSNTNILIGIFAKNDTTSDPKVLSVGNYYLWVMNKDTTATTNVTVTLRGNYTSNIQVSPRVLNYVSNPNPFTYTASSSSYNATLNTTDFTIPALGGGEGIMVKLFSGANVGAPADYDGDKITDISIKENDGTWLIDYSGNGFGNWDWYGTGYGNQTWHPVPADYDGDHKADISIKSDAGDWKIDYSADGYNGWQFSSTAYGDATAHPVPADYDGDGKADLSVKTDAGGWLINYAANGFAGWDVSLTTYGDATAHPVPADYDGDGKADLSVKTDAGAWLINYAANGFAGWDVSLSTYGDSTAHPVPADYDGDGKADLGIKTNAGSWLINYQNNGFAGWDVGVSGYGTATAIPLPGDYGGDKKTDLSIKYPNGDWKIDYAVNGFGSWDNIILKPLYDSTGFSGRLISGPVSIASEATAILDEGKLYKILAIYDLSGRLYQKINRKTTLRDIKNTSNCATGIYFVRMIIDSKVSTRKIFISR